MTPPDDVYTHGHHESVLRSHQWRTAENSAGYLLDALAPGTRVLDVGCGPGTITVDFAQRVAPGRVVGLDRADEVLDSARARLRATRASTTWSSPRATCTRSTSPDASFDVVHAHQVLQHLTDPVAALREMRRVCGPGGIVAARDSDYATFTWWPERPAPRHGGSSCTTTSRAATAPSPMPAVACCAWARQAGFADVEATASVWCFATPEDRAWWGGLWADRVVGLGVRRSGDRRRARDSSRARARSRAAWRAWSESPDAWFAILHGELRATAIGG